MPTVNAALTEYQDGTTGLNPYDNAAQGVGGSIGGTIQRAVIGQATSKINSGISKIIGGKAGAASRISTGEPGWSYLCR